jgi:hypothetical protein
MEVDLVLLNGERRKFVVPGHTGSMASVLDRLDEWVETKGGGWVQKRFIVEVRPATGGDDETEVEQGGREEELRQPTDAASSLADQADA